MELQRDNFTGKMEQYPDYGPQSGWLGGTGESWERGPYYARGLVALAYALQDEALIGKAKKWMDYALRSQTEDGNFGPQIPGDGDELQARREAVRRDWWPRMPMLMALRDYCGAEELRGTPDARVMPFFEKYLKYQLRELPRNPLSGWAKARGADNAEIALWYYGRTGEAFALETAELLMSQTDDWNRRFTREAVRCHGVNTAQAFKYPYIAYRLSGDEAQREALRSGLLRIRKDHGRIDWLPNADEAARDNLFTRGSESCAVAEGMLSMEENGRVTGESGLYDLLECWAHNSLPNCFTYDLSRHCYFQLQNQVMAAMGTHGFDCDHGDSCAFGAPSGFDCCFANLHMAYPKFVQNMWQRTEDGFALVCCGENELHAEFHGKQIRFAQHTRYPYGDSVQLEYLGEEAAFRLELRVPEWSRSCRLSVNGEKNPSLPGEYLCLNRTFRPGDRISMEFDSEVEVCPWHFDSVFLRRGAVLYCLPVGEKVRFAEDENLYREIAMRAPASAKTEELFPASRWNYALDVKSFIYRENSGEISLTPDAPPAYIKAWGIADENWELSGNTAGQHPQKKQIFSEDSLEELTLIPYSCTRLKISVFPKVYRVAGGETKIDCCAFRSCGCVTVDFQTVPDADEMLLLVHSDRQTLYHIPCNPYHSAWASFAKRDRFSFSAADSSQMMLQVLAVKSNAVTARSKLTTV